MPAVRDGDRVLMVDRRLFREDNSRFFVGAVEEYDDGVLRIRGFSFHLNPYEVAGTERHGEERVRIASLASGDQFYLLPRELDISKVNLRRSPKSLMLTDGGALTMDLSEWLLRS
jgi:hypothetical protein